MGEGVKSYVKSYVKMHRLLINRMLMSQQESSNACADFMSSRACVTSLCPVELIDMFGVASLFTRDIVFVIK